MIYKWRLVENSIHPFPGLSTTAVGYAGASRVNQFLTLGYRTCKWVQKKNRKLEELGQCIPPPRHVLLVSRYGSGSGWIHDPDRIQNSIIILFTGPLSTFPENFIQIRSEVFVRSCRQTNNYENITFLEEVINIISA